MSSLLIILSSLALILKAQNYDCQKSNTWVQLPKMPIQTGEVASVIIGDNLFVAGEDNTETYKFSFSSNTWTKIADRVYQGNHQNSFVHVNGNNVYWWLVGGIDSNSYGKVQVYNTTDGKWGTRATMPWDGGSVCVAMIDNIIYACGGIQGFDGGKDGGGTNTTNKCASYSINTGDKWEMMDFKNFMPYGRNHAATGVSGDGRMFVIGGRIGKNVASNGYNNIQVYDPKKGTWTTSEEGFYKPIPQARGGTGHAAYNDGKFYVFGGETSSDPNATSNKVYNRTDIYDVSSNTWSRGVDMPHPRHGIFPVFYKDAIYIAAGGLHNGYNVSDVFDKYCI